eukprot:gene2505-2855_t
MVDSTYTVLTKYLSTNQLGAIFHNVKRLYTEVMHLKIVVIMPGLERLSFPRYDIRDFDHMVLCRLPLRYLAVDSVSSQLLPYLRAQTTLTALCVLNSPFIDYRYNVTE